MAQLPDLTALGTRPTPESGRQLVSYDGSAPARAMQGLGEGLAHVGNEMYQLDQAKQRADAGLALAKITNAMHDAHDEVARGVQDGQMDPDAADAEFKKRVADIRTQGLAGLGERQRQLIADNLEATSGGLQRGLTGVVIKRKQVDIAGTIDQFSEQAQRDASRIGPQWSAQKFGAFVDFNGPAAGLNPDQISKLKQSFAEKVHYTYFDTEGTKALMAGDVGGIDAVLKQVNGPEGEVIDPLKRTQLSHQLFGYKEHILAQQARAQGAADTEALRRNNEAVAEYNKATDVVLNGQYMSPDYIKTLTTMAAGTSVEQSVGALISSQREVAGFASRPASERDAILERMRNESADPKKGSDPVQFKLLQQVERVNKEAKQAVDDNPFGAAQKYGVIQDAPVFDMNSPEAVVAAVGERMKTIGKVEAWAGRKVSPLQPQEVVQVSKMLQKLPPEQAAGWLGSLGQTLGDPERINAVASELDKGNKPLALALKLGTDQTNAGRVVSEFVLRGHQAIQDKQIKRDDSTLTGWRADLSTMIRGTLGDKQAEDDAIDAAYYTRAALDVGGIASPGFSLPANNRKAVELVLGVPIDRAGVKTILPRGMNESAFDAKLRTFTPDVLRAMAPSGEVYVNHQPRKLESLSSGLTSMGMRRDGQGKYIPTTAGMLVTLDKDGMQPLRLDIK